jgi:hypothetical protein
MADDGPPDQVGVDEEGFQYDLYDHVADETEPEPPEGERSLDSLRVRQLAATRRGTYRARSYCVIALGACAVAAAQLMLMTVRHVRYAGWQLRPVGYVCGTLAAAMASVFLYRRAAELTRELRLRPAALAEPQTPPDFSTLSDGSHYWKNLEQMNDGA